MHNALIDNLSQKNYHPALWAPLLLEGGELK